MTLSAPLSCRTTVPASPVTLPPTVKEPAVQLMVTLLTSPAPTLPLPPATVQTWAGTKAG